MLANALKILNGDGGKWRRRFIEILEALLQDRRNIVDARENLATARLIIRRGHSERFHEGGECLLDVEIRIAFPARIPVELPANAR